ncbi:hypothetical protein [Fimbriiglobus ruber]|uniref:Glycosyl hydrolase n=1 Tax=Fimbriiglobus ruber TaxID=1908690 RepID=A0A225DZ05_9BACT|nr:hypothetical protein [Fimbriiglobus ruber]OWK46532.1 glycosyl hydrolase [Fimbriiglobus ruber]
MAASLPWSARALGLLAALLVCPPAWGQQPVSLMTPKDAWSFNNGAEFPGATGSLSVAPAAKLAGRDSLKLVGDFTKGGNYVQAGRKIDNIDVRELSFWVRSSGGEQFTVRLNDASGQTHQINLKLEAKDDWQRVVLPLERFFARRGQADAITMVSKYEYWGGAKDGQWHGPATGLYLLLGNNGPTKVRTLWLNDIAILPRPKEVPGAEVTTVVRLDEVLDGEHDWRFTRGEEFPGAKGSFTVVKDQPAAGQSCLKLAGDFTKGGAYVAAVKNLRELDVKDVAAVRMKVKSDNATRIGVQLVDGSGQTHQAPRPITADGQWHDLTIKPTEIAGGEHWGGANDGKWHGPLSQIALSVSDKSDEKTKQPTVLLADMRAECLLPVFAQPAAFKADFEGLTKLPEGWATQGNVAIDSGTAAQGSRSLVLTRSLEEIDRPCTVTSPTFAVAPGRWAISLACKADLNSSDNSYRGAVDLEALDAAGKVVERITLAEQFGKRDWQPIKKQVDLPKGVTAARFQVRLDKTHGRFWLDDLSAAYLAPAPRKDDRISRLLFSTARLGNLLFPDDPRRVNVTVEATKPLRDEQLAMTWEVRDYWGAEQSRPATATLQRAGKKDNRLAYEATIDLGPLALEVGRYYELHAAIPLEGGEPFRNFTSLAILPEAETKKFKPEEVPFTSRNWDNRFTEYFQLTDRLGIRTCGVWGGWSAKPPYPPEAPNIELCEKLGMGVLTGTPIATIESGKKDYDEKALRQGVRNFVEKYGKYRPLIVNLGNEPHGTGERVQANVAAYKIVYEEIKKVAPQVTVVATSVEPNEEYFKAGYGQWCDAYDFHIYETPADIRRTIGEYHELMKKYGQVKPIWSTELGLNSQGLPRHTVAVDLTKKFATFFAAGGASASWFGLIYPDADAKSYGSSGDSHNVFDCRYNRYCPRLDAVAYYNTVNAISIKKFVEERLYPDGVHAFYFRDRDGRALQVLWKDKGRQDVFIPLPGVEQVRIVRADGSRRTLDANKSGVTLGVTEDPLLLLYDGGEKQLAKELGKPAVSLDTPPQMIARRAPTTLTVTLDGKTAGDVDLIVPPSWGVKKETDQATNSSRSAVRFVLTPPATSAVREADLTVTLKGQGGKRQGELYFRCPIAE